MASLITAANPANEANSVPEGVYRWPRSVVRWLFGLPDDDREPGGSSRAGARFLNICISREAGAGGAAIARMVGEKLGWKVYDDELLEAIAHRMGVSLDEVRALDELAPSVVQDWLLPLREEYYAPQEAYLDHLARLIEAIGRAGDSILVGRGAGFMLPRESTLSIRVVAPLRVRAQRLAERMGVSYRTARRAARDLDRRRDQFDRTMHRANSQDSHSYDMVLESHSLGLETSAMLVAHLVRAGRAAPGFAQAVKPAAEPRERMLEPSWVPQAPETGSSKPAEGEPPVLEQT